MASGSRLMFCWFSFKSGVGVGVESGLLGFEVLMLRLGFLSLRIKF